MPTQSNPFASNPTSNNPDPLNRPGSYGTSNNPYGHPITNPTNNSSNSSSGSHNSGGGHRRNNNNRQSNPTTPQTPTEIPKSADYVKGGKGVYTSDGKFYPTTNTKWLPPGYQRGFVDIRDDGMTIVPLSLTSNAQSTKEGVSFNFPTTNNTIINSELRNSSNSSSTERSFTLNDIDWSSTFEGGLPKNSSKINAQTYLFSYKAPEILNYASDKLGSFFPNSSTKDFLFSKNRQFDTSQLVKFGLFSPLLATRTESLNLMLKKGDLIPESKTTFYSVVKPLNENKATFDVLSKTKILNKDYFGVARGYALTSEKGAVSIGKSFSLNYAKKGGVDVIYSPFVSAQRNLGEAKLFINKDFGIAASLPGTEAISSRTISKQLEGFNIKSGSIFPTNQRVSFYKNLKLEKGFQKLDVFGVTKPLNDDGSQFLFIGETNRLRGLNQPNILGKIFVNKQPNEQIFKDIDFIPSSSNPLQLKGLVSNNIPQVSSTFEKNAINFFKQDIARTNKFQNIFKSSSLGTTSFTQTRSQSLYYGTGQYERTNQQGGLLFDTNSNKLNIGLSFGQGQLGKIDSSFKMKNIFDLGQSNKQKPLSFSIPKFDTAQLTNQKLATPPELLSKNTRGNPFSNTPFITPKIPFEPFALPPLPKLSFDTSLGGRKSGTRKYKRTPSLISFELGITSPRKALGESTGLVARPILTGKRGKRGDWGFGF